jgi:hypothetical protein
MALGCIIFCICIVHAIYRSQKCISRTAILRLGVQNEHICMCRKGLLKGHHSTQAGTCKCSKATVSVHVFMTFQFSQQILLFH